MNQTDLFERVGEFVVAGMFATCMWLAFLPLF